MKYSVDFDIELLKNPYKGLYIALEGIDGSGKTTQVDALVAHYEKKGQEVVRTHEPRRDGVMGPLVTGVLTKEIKLPEVAIQYLFAAQRAAFLEQLVIPALERGAIVISDRCFWTSIPYGLLDRFESKHEESADLLLASLSVLSMYHEFIAPDISFVLDVSVDTAVERLSHLGRESELYEKKEKLLKIKNGYDFLLEKFPEELAKINAERGAIEITEDLLQKLQNLPK